MLMLTKNPFSLVVGWPSNSRCDVSHNVLQTLHTCSLGHSIYVQRKLNTHVVACCKENAMAGQGEIPTTVKRAVAGNQWCIICNSTSQLNYKSFQQDKTTSRQLISRLDSVLSINLSMTDPCMSHQVCDKCLRRVQKVEDGRVVEQQLKDQFNQTYDNA